RRDRSDFNFTGLTMWSCSEIFAFGRLRTEVVTENHARILPTGPRIKRTMHRSESGLKKGLLRRCCPANPRTFSATAHRNGYRPAPNCGSKSITQKLIRLRRIELALDSTWLLDRPRDRCGGWICATGTSSFPRERRTTRSDAVTTLKPTS